MNIWVNNQEIEFSGQNTLSALIENFGASGSFAIALNGRFVSRSQYQSTTVNEGDKVEILSPIAGG